MNNYCYEARKNGVVSLLLEKHMHAVVYGLISCLIRHPKEGSLIYWCVFQVSHFGSSLQAGQCMQQQHLLKAATIYVTSADDKDMLLLCFCCCCRICRNAMADDMTQNVKICGTFFFNSNFCHEVDEILTNDFIHCYRGFPKLQLLFYDFCS